MDLSPSRPTIDKVIDFFARTRWVWALFMSTTLVLIALGIVNIPKMQFGPNTQVIAISSIISFVLFIIPAKKLVDRFYTPEYELLISANAERDDPIKGYAVGRKKMQELDIKPDNKDVYTARASNGLLKNYLREFDLEELEGKVNWHGMIEEIKILETQENIKELRISRRKILQEALIYQTKLPSIIEEITASYYKNETFKITEFAGKLEKEVQKELKEKVSIEEEKEDQLGAKELIEELKEDGNGDLNAGSRE